MTFLLWDSQLLSAQLYSLASMLILIYFFRYEDGTELLPLDEEELVNEDTEAYVTNLSYYHLVPFETDILE